MPDETLYLYTSLSAGSSHIVTATSRIETILKANKIPFKAVDCATDDKARMIWQRRSKGKKLPGLVKYQDVVADLEQVEEWNEHGELKDQIEDVEDIFGDMPVSGSVAEAQAAAAQREAQQAAAKGDKPPAPIRQASETRHISISEPKRDKSPASLLGKDTTVAMAMKQAGAEAAAKAGQKKTTAGTATTDSSSSNAPTSISSEIKREPDMEDHNTANTEAKTPALLAEEGVMKMTIEKLQSGNEADTSKSNKEQILDQRRKSSVPQTRSSLAETTSIDQSHTMETVVDDEDEKSPGGETHASKVSATSKEEEKVLQGTRPQQQSATAVEHAGDSVGD